MNGEIVAGRFPVTQSLALELAALMAQVPAECSLRLYIMLLSYFWRIKYLLVLVNGLVLFLSRVQWLMK